MSKRTKLRKSLWTANPKGGVGKTTLALILAATYEAAGRPLAAVDADSKGKLAGFLPGVVSLGTGASVAEIKKSPTAAISYWDKLADVILDNPGDTLVDLGANVDRSVWEWADKSAIGAEFSESGIDVEVWAPVTTEPEAMSGGMDVLRAVGAVFPAAKRVLVLNEAAGDFSAYRDQAEYREIAALAEAGQIFVVPFPKCLSEGWVHFEREKIPVHRVLGMSRQDVETRFGLSRREAARALADLADWVQAVYQGFGTLVPTPAAD